MQLKLFYLWWINASVKLCILKLQPPVIVSAYMETISLLYQFMYSFPVPLYCMIITILMLLNCIHVVVLCAYQDVTSDMITRLH